MWTHQFLEYQYAARSRGWTEFVSMQNLYNAIYREEEREMYPACSKLGVGGIPWSPVTMGFLTRPWEEFNTTARGEGQGKGFFGQLTTEEDKKINDKIREIAEARGVTMATVAIAWVLSKPFITAPILGMSKKERVDEAISAAVLQLSPADADVHSIDELYAPKRVIGFS
ncbi:Aryl-alcohol dehydrogenase NADP [Tolypocladium paradoxum]|uniref:Aryl-alcohol dehydrogenase NADP n=1 Tax=Tolypocladium paradoxum TaxID=94208 RepID=A0A2S4KNI6_9HYPO|nr:Aryl-alcohol dehydrogenase NADP [Tolypocladium paradoxum]